MKKALPAKSSDVLLGMTIAPATVRRLVSEAVKLNAQLGDPTHVADRSEASLGVRDNVHWRSMIVERY